MFHPFLLQKLEKESLEMETVQKGMAQVPSSLLIPLFFQSNYLSWVNFHGSKDRKLHNLPPAEFGYNFSHFLRRIRLYLLHLWKTQVTLTVLHLPKELHSLLPKWENSFNPKYKIAGIPTQPKKQCLWTFSLGFTIYIRNELQVK